MNYGFLSETKLFSGIKPEEIKDALCCLSGYEKSFKKGEIIYRTGQTVTDMGLVEEGSVNITVNLYWGSSIILGNIEKGKIFAETYAAVSGKEMLCDAVAAEDCRVLFINVGKLLNVCKSTCGFHQKIIHNLLRISAMKNLNLSERMLHTAPKTIRGRLISYFSQTAAETGGREFTIPFSRQELADYIGVDRSALSAELSKMQKDGILTYRKNEFKLNKNADLIVM